MSIDQAGFARQILDDFIKECLKYNKRYFPSIPWDIKMLEDILEYYDKAFVVELLNEYARYNSDPTIRYFTNNIQKIAKDHVANVESSEEFQRKMADTKKRMHK